MDVASTVAANMEALAENTYPGRGIVIGMTPDEERFVQIYWIMGRSENSQNRVFVEEDGDVRTAPFDESKVEDPSLIIYNCVRSFSRCHIVSNGDQTDTLFDALQVGRRFEEALYTRTFEPDAPNFTPRIAGVVNLNDPRHAYKLGIIKAIANDGAHCTRQFFDYETPIPGVGHCVTTYSGDGDPLPAFEGEPYVVELHDDIDELLDLYWETLNEDNKISLLVKFIGLEGEGTDLRIVNKHG
ncbi:MAG: IMP cyclohydrolase [Candidatus Brocadiia bacterium]